MPATPYHHGHLREALVEEATKAAREHGPDGVALRELARRVGVSHNAAYRHFAHRDDLLAAVAARAMTEVVAAMDRDLALVHEDDPVVRARRRLASIGRAYVTFALTEPGLFTVAFASDPQGGDLRTVSQGPYALLGEVLDELVEVGFMAPWARPGAEVTCWSAMHGFAVLSIDGPLSDVEPRERDESLEQVLAAIDRSYAATTGTTTGGRAGEGGAGPST